MPRFLTDPRHYWAVPATTHIRRVGAPLRRLAADGVTIVEEWDEPEYVSVKCLDPDGYVVEAAWEPHLR